MPDHVVCRLADFRLAFAAIAGLLALNPIWLIHLLQIFAPTFDEADCCFILKTEPL
jgi:hypothetical protein